MAGVAADWDETVAFLEATAPYMAPRGVVPFSEANAPAVAIARRVDAYQRMTEHVKMRYQTMPSQVLGILWGPDFAWVWTPGSHGNYEWSDEKIHDGWAVDANTAHGPEWHRFMRLTGHYLARHNAPMDAAVLALAWLLPIPSILDAARRHTCVTRLARTMIVPESVARVRVHELLGRVCPNLTCARHSVAELRAA